MIAIDADYERMTGEPKWEVQYWWPDRCWRRVQVCRFQFGKVEPVDPDRHMQDETGLFPSVGASSRRLKNDQRVVEVLQAEGPKTAMQLAKITGMKRDTIRAILVRRPDLFEHDNQTTNPVWRLVEA